MHITLTAVYYSNCRCCVVLEQCIQSCPSALFPHYLGKHLPVCSEAQAAEIFRLSEKSGGARPLGWGMEEKTPAERAEWGCSAAWNITAKKQRSAQSYPLPFNLILVQLLKPCSCLLPLCVCVLFLFHLTLVEKCSPVLWYSTTASCSVKYFVWLQTNVSLHMKCNSIGF